ncbi:hypothetical protein DC74_p00002 (plasmid) [Streptomyces noursei]|nr:hypothetical protein DC74_p00002 [Streptomyces noursei]
MDRAVQTWVSPRLGMAVTCADGVHCGCPSVNCLEIKGA